jgi:hypothetical protein
MIFARNASIIELAMNPHVDRCYGYMAMALNMDYWILPQLNAFYHLPYVATYDNVAALTRLVTHIIKQRKLHYLLLGRLRPLAVTV